MQLNNACCGDVTKAFKQTCTMSRLKMRSSMTCICRQHASNEVVTSLVFILARGLDQAQINDNIQRVF